MTGIVLDWFQTAVASALNSYALAKQLTCHSTKITRSKNVLRGGSQVEQKNKQKIKDENENAIESRKRRKKVVYKCFFSVAF